MGTYDCNQPAAVEPPEGPDNRKINELAPCPPKKPVGGPVEFGY